MGVIHTYGIIRGTTLGGTADTLIEMPENCVGRILTWSFCNVNAANTYVEIWQVISGANNRRLALTVPATSTTVLNGVWVLHPGDGILGKRTGGSCVVWADGALLTGELVTP